MVGKEELDLLSRVQMSLYGNDTRIEKLRGKVEYDEEGNLVYKIKDDGQDTD